MKNREFLAGLILVVAVNNPVQAVTVNFGCITSNDPSGESCAIAESQISVELTDATDADGAAALFSFYNSGPDLEAFISDVYFMDGTLLGISSIDNSHTGVSFSEGANPSHLPAYQATASFSADNDPGAHWGVQTGEYLGITFDLLEGISFSDTVNALSTGDLVLGIHVQGLGAGADDTYSESMVNVVPIPAAAWLFGSGLIGLAGLARRERKI